MNLGRFNVTDKIGSTRYKRGYEGVTIKRWTGHAVRSTTTKSMGLIPHSQWCSRTTSNCPCTTTDTSFRGRLSRNARCLRLCPPRGVSPRGGCRVQGLPGPCLGPCNYHAENERYVKILKVKEILVPPEVVTTRRLMQGKSSHTKAKTSIYSLKSIGYSPDKSNFM